MNLNELAKQVHQQNHNWWHDIENGEPIVRNKCELLMLVITELAEAVEGMRKNLMDDKLTHRRMEEVEMADAFIRLLDYAGGFNIYIETPEQPYVTRGENKAEQLLRICEIIIRIEAYEPSWLSVSLSMIKSYCQLNDLDLGGAVVEKLAYNKTRADHSVEHRKSEHGKKF